MMPDWLYWREPLWLLMLPIPVFLLLYGFLQQRRTAHRLVDRHLLPWLRAGVPSAAGKGMLALMLLAWGLLCLALAGPRTPRYIPPELQRSADTFMVIVDFSASMQARDGKPEAGLSRLRAAQQVLQQGLAGFPRTASIGLIVFAGHAHLLLEATDDHELIEHYLEQLPQLRLPTLGNDLASAIELAEKQFSAHQGQRSHLLLLTDGDLDDNAKHEAETRFEQLFSSFPVSFRIVGLGGPESVRVPQSRQPLRDDGKAVLSRIDSAWLKKMAAATDDGQFIYSRKLADPGLKDFVSLSSARLSGTEADQVLWMEWFAFPLVLAIVVFLFVLEMTPGKKTDENH